MRPQEREVGGRRYRPYAFTEQGVAMLSSVLNSERAIQVNIEIMRAFVRLRRILASHADLARKLDALEKKYDAQFKVVFDAIRELMKPPESKKRPIGFLVEEPKVPYLTKRKGKVRCWRRGSDVVMYDMYFPSALRFSVFGGSLYALCPVLYATVLPERRI